MHYSLATTMSFTHSVYSVNENDGSAQPGLVLSYPSSTVITAHLTTTDRSATGEYCVTSLCCVCVCTVWLQIFII